MAIKCCLAGAEAPKLTIGFYRKLDKWTEAEQPAKETPQKAANFTYPFNERGVTWPQATLESTKDRL